MPFLSFGFNLGHAAAEHLCQWKDARSYPLSCINHQRHLIIYEFGIHMNMMHKPNGIALVNCVDRKCHHSFRSCGRIAKSPYSAQGGSFTFMCVYAWFLLVSVRKSFR